MINAYQHPDDAPDSVALFPLRGVILLPRAQVPLKIFEPRYLSMVDAVLKTDHRMIGMVQTRGEGEELLEKVGCLGRITQFSESFEGQYIITLTGIARFTIADEKRVKTPFRQAYIECFKDDFSSPHDEKDVPRDQLITALKAFLAHNDMDADWDDIRQTRSEILVNALSVMSPWGEKEKQALLEAESLKMRADLLIALSERALTQGKKPQKQTLQ
jgi:uncharacterized protein